jgi:hypothetical protein
MCDLHLVETERRLSTWKGPCSLCQLPIVAPCVEVLGTLDDGSPETQILRYHDGCLQDIDDGDSIRDGCLWYGEISERIRQ